MLWGILSSVKFLAKVTCKYLFSKQKCDIVNSASYDVIMQYITV